MPLLFSSTINNTVHGGSTLDVDSVQASRSERLIPLVKCGACVQHDKRVVNDWSLIDTGRGTMVQHPHKTLPGLNFIPTLGYFP